MLENFAYHFHLEWPAAGGVVSGPVVWLRGWLVGRNGHDFVDIRAQVRADIHLGVLGLPRVDLAAHFKSHRAWLPAEFVIGVPLPDGPAEIHLAALDACGAWHDLPKVLLSVASHGSVSPRVEGKVVPHAQGSWTVRGTHQPFAGHLDDPVESPVGKYGRTAVFGWLLHDAMPVRSVVATTDLLVFNHLTHGLTDDSLAAKVSHPRARHARLKGEVDLPLTLTSPACLRVYAEMADGSVQLCFAQRLIPPIVTEPIQVKLNRPAHSTSIVSGGLPALPSGRPRRLLLVTLNLQADDATRRALGVARHLVRSHGWAARLITTADGPLRGAFEAAGIDVQIVDALALFSAQDSAAVESALTKMNRQIWWRGLNAVAVFDPLCFWAIALARRQTIPVLFDCTLDIALAPPADASDALAAAMVAGWKSASKICHASAAGPALQVSCLGGMPAEIVSYWAEPAPANQPSAPGFIAAPIGGFANQGASILLRAADWLVRRDVVLPWRIAVTDLRGAAEEMKFVEDAVLNLPTVMAVESLAGVTVAALVCPAFCGHPIHALLDAAAAGMPIVTTSSPVISALFGPHDVSMVPPGNSLALAHALADLAANPAAAARRAENARTRVLTDHLVAPNLAHWQQVLESIVSAQT